MTRTFGGSASGRRYWWRRVVVIDGVLCVDRTRGDRRCRHRGVLWVKPRERLNLAIAACVTEADRADWSTAPFPRIRHDRIGVGHCYCVCENCVAFCRARVPCLRKKEKKRRLR